MSKYLNRGISTPIAIGIITVLVVVIGGGILAYQHYYIVKEQPEIQPSTTEIPTISSEDKLTPEELSQRLSECKNIQDYFDQNACYGNLAIDANDPSICPEFGSAVCRYFIFMWHTDLCSDIPIKKPNFEFDENQATLRDLDKKQECIKKIAIDTKNAELCGNLFDQAADCQNTVALELNDSSKCSDYPGDCVMKIAINKKDITICESKYDKAWCIAIFPKLLQESSYRQNQQCYIQPIDTGYGYGGQPKYDYSYPNTYDNGVNDYPKDIAPEPAFHHILSVPFNVSNAILRVYSSSGNAGFIRLIKYSLSDNSSELVGDIRSKTGGNWGGIYIPIAISKHDSHILFKAQMGSPGAGGGSVTMGYAYLSLASAKYDDCGYLNPEKIANQAYFYDNFSKALFYSEEKNVPPSERPGPYYNSAIKFINIMTTETKTLLKEPNTIYEVINVDEESGVVSFKSCPWQKYRFNCPISDESTQSRSISLP